LRQKTPTSLAHPTPRAKTHQQAEDLRKTGRRDAKPAEKETGAGYGVPVAPGDLRLRESQEKPPMTTTKRLVLTNRKEESKAREKTMGVSTNGNRHSTFMPCISDSYLPRRMEYCLLRGHPINKEGWALNLEKR